MTQDTAQLPLDERGLEAALKVFEADHGENSEAYLSAAIRAYLQTAAADVSGLVERLNAIDEAAMYEAPATTEATIAEAATTLQTLSASNAALEAENEKLQDKVDGLEADLDNAIETAFARGAVEWTYLNYPKHYARLSAIFAPKGGQDHG